MRTCETDKKVLIVGYGSIGRRHARVFKDLGSKVFLVTKSRDTTEPSFPSVGSALLAENPDIVVIANDTAQHQETVKTLCNCGYDGIVLVEKPVFTSPISISHSFSRFLVAYNLRLSPLISQLKTELIGQNALTAEISCGQYLPQWRPDRDYRDTYSSKTAQGGGVLRDLSHEIDYAQWLFGNFTHLAAQGGHFSELEIETDDVFHIIGQTERCRSISLAINYLDRVPRRTIVVNTNHNTYAVDFITGSLTKNGTPLVTHARTSDTYIEQATRLLHGHFDGLCTLEEAIQTLKVLQAAEEARDTQCFIQL